jgi:hypothetical protein
MVTLLIRRPSNTLGNDVQACQAAFNTVCTYIGTRDLVQEHIDYNVWPLVREWEMSKEAAAGSSQGGLVYLKYTFRFRNQFDEPNDDWLDAIEATSDEILGAYSRAEVEVMTVAFGAHDKKRLNRVFDVIGFVYPDYCYPIQKQGRKRKVAALTSASVPKGKKIKVLTCKLRHIEMNDMQKLIERAETTPIVSKTASAMLVEVIADPARVPESEKVVGKVLEQPKKMVTALPKLSATIGTPRKRRMASVLEFVLESVKTPPPSAEASGSKTEDVTGRITASTSARAEAGPSENAPENLVKESLPEKPSAPAPKAPSKSDLNFIVRHASGKQLSGEQVAKTEHFAKELKYPHGSLVYGGDNNDDLIYRLPDSKDINVCREIMDNMGYPKLELGLSMMTKDQLVDSLAYNILKVCIL